MINLGQLLKESVHVVYNNNKKLNRVICKEDKKIFTNILECARYYNVSKSSIHCALKNKSHYSRKLNKSFYYEGDLYYEFD